MELVGPVDGTRSDAIHRALRRAILDGTYGPDTALPSERQLSEELGASRHAVREALKRLQQAGLIAISQGGATRVRGAADDGQFPPKGMVRPCGKSIGPRRADTRAGGAQTGSRCDVSREDFHRRHLLLVC